MSPNWPFRVPALGAKSDAAPETSHHHTHWRMYASQSRGGMLRFGISQSISLKEDWPAKHKDASCERSCWRSEEKPRLPFWASVPTDEIPGNTSTECWGTGSERSKVEFFSNLGRTPAERPTSESNRVHSCINIRIMQVIYAYVLVASRESY